MCCSYLHILCNLFHFLFPCNLHCMTKLTIFIQRCVIVYKFVAISVYSINTKGRVMTKIVYYPVFLGEVYININQVVTEVLCKVCITRTKHS